jgi:hypothetical protein
VQKSPWDKARNVIRSLAQIQLQIHRSQERTSLQATPASQGGESTTARRKADGCTALQSWIPMRRQSKPFTSRRRELPERTQRRHPPLADERHLGRSAKQRRGREPQRQVQCWPDETQTRASQQQNFPSLLAPTAGQGRGPMRAPPSHQPSSPPRSAKSGGWAAGPRTRGPAPNSPRPAGRSGRSWGQTRRRPAAGRGGCHPPWTDNRCSEQRPLRRTPPQRRWHLQTFQTTLTLLPSHPPAATASWSKRRRTRRAAEAATYSGAVGPHHQTLHPPTRTERGGVSP